MALRRFTMAIIQFTVGEDKCENMRKAVSFIKAAVAAGSKLIALPECFNSPYGTQYFKYYAEEIPNGMTSQALSKVAQECGVYVVGGSIPECDGCNWYNTCTVWNPNGELIATHRKVHMFDIDIPGGMQFKESDILTAGKQLTTFQTDMCKIGIGICYDLRFEEMARIYRKQGCDVILYPGAFNMCTGPMHWETLLRCRAIDNQVYVAGISPATDQCAKYVAYGHSMIISPWGKILTSAEHEDSILYAIINLDEVKDARQQIPTGDQRRHDIYETIYKACSHCTTTPCKTTSCTKC
ncbi:hypothetical protein RUM43_006915 [Polyplax serrata]|uniref:omega-amidase n=1 Tax=Polyplax serrata TaxID=468196 RepID=A0AAN8PLM9_POLSC